MTTAPSLSKELETRYAEETAKILQQFAASGEGRAAVQQRTALVESVAIDLWKELVSPEPDRSHGLSLVAIGGFGRSWLFPYSDVDILFLHAGENSEAVFKDQIRIFSQRLWDLRLRLSPSSRTLAECDRFDSQNVEFAIS